MRKLRGWKMTQRHKCLLYKPQDAHEKSSPGAPALTPVLRRRQDHLRSLTAAILANWRVPDAMKDTHLKDKVKMTEKIRCQPLVSAYICTHTWRRRWGKMNNERSLSKWGGMRMQGRRKLSGLAPSLPHGELRIKFRSSTRQQVPFHTEPSHQSYFCSILNIFPYTWNWQVILLN